MTYISLVLACLILLALGLSDALREVPNETGTIERWELPKSSVYKNTRPLIGIMTQECLLCPGLFNLSGFGYHIVASRARFLQVNPTSLLDSSNGLRLQVHVRYPSGAGSHEVTDFPASQFNCT